MKKKMKKLMPRKKNKFRVFDAVTFAR